MFVVKSEVINAILTFILFDHYLLSYLLVDRNYLLSHVLVDRNYLLSHLLIHRNWRFIWRLISWFLLKGVNYVLKNGCNESLSMF